MKCLALTSFFAVFSYVSFASPGEDSFFIPASDSLRVKSLLDSSDAYLRDDPNVAERFAGEALELSTELAWEKGMSLAFLRLGKSKLSQDSYDTAILYFDKAIQLSTSLGEANILLDARTDRSDTYRRKGNLSLAFSEAFNILKITDSIGDTRRKANVLRDIGEMYRNQEDGPNAIKYLTDAMEISMSRGDSLGALIAEHNMALAHKHIDQPEKTVEIMKSLFHKYPGFFRKDDSARVYSNIGNGLMDLESYKEAEVYLLKSYEMRKDAKFPRSKAYALKELGYLYNQLDQPERSIYYNEQAYKIAKSINFPFLLRDIYGTLADANKKVGNYDRAFELLKEQREFTAELMDQERIALSQELRTKYEAEKNEQQILLQNAQLARQQSELSNQSILRNALAGGLILVSVIGGLIYRNQRIKGKSLKEKDALLREIHHRVKNNLQVISSLLNMQSREAESEEMLGAIQEGQSRVKAMALIHQKLYQTENITEIDFQEYAEDLHSQLSALYKREGLEIENKIDASNLKLDIDTAIPLGLIMNELISNAYKYAFEGATNGKINIGLSRVDEKIQLEISDDGKGLPENFSIENVASLGLKLVNILTKQLKGTLNFESGSGTKFSILFDDLKLKLT